MTTDPTPAGVGRVVGLWRYPVKSMRSETLTHADVSWHGFAGDRRWAFVRDGMDKSGFPWLTLRERADMNQYRPEFADPSRPDRSATIVHTPGGNQFDVTDRRLADELWPDGVRVIRQDRGVFDTFPLSLITTQTIAELGRRLGSELGVDRFRPNILVRADAQEPFAEDLWVGSTLRIGSMRMRIDKRDGRCAVITIDPLTSQRNAAVLKTVVQEREGCLGVYGSTVEPGRMSLDDVVYLE